MLDYLAPSELEIGAIVAVPLGPRRVRGWLIGTEPPQVATGSLKPILRAGPGHLTPEIIELTRWTAEHYCGSWRSVLIAASACAPRRGKPDIWHEATETRTACSQVELVVQAPAHPRLELILQRIAARGSTIVLVPDHRDMERLLPQLARAQQRPVIAWDPQAGAEHRAHAWRTARRGGVIVVGARSAVWAPVPDLASGLVLDEHDESFQSESQPTWHAREVLARRLARRGRPLTLISPTPSFGALELAGEHILGEPAEEARRGWANLETIDPRETPPRERPFSSTLVDRVRETLDESGVLIVRNETGGIVLSSCHACGELARCGECGAAARAKANTLECPRGHQVRSECAACGGITFRAVRRGASGMTEVVRGLFPRVEVHEVTNASESITAIGSGNIAIGTEAVLRRVSGYIGLVIFLDFDRDMLAPRIRAGEQALALLARASRLVRGDRGTVIVETRVPDHVVLAAAKHGNPMSLMESERPARIMLGLPPFGALAELKCAGTELVLAIDEIRTVLGDHNADLQGPDAVGRFLVRADTTEVLQLALTVLHARVPSVRIYVDPPRV